MDTGFGRVVGEFSQGIEQQSAGVVERMRASAAADDHHAFGTNFTGEANGLPSVPHRVVEAVTVGPGEATDPGDRRDIQ